jgi:hypothetical protein
MNDAVYELVTRQIDVAAEEGVTMHVAIDDQLRPGVVVSSYMIFFMCAADQQDFIQRFSSAGHQLVQA